MGLHGELRAQVRAIIKEHRRLGAEVSLADEKKIDRLIPYAAFEEQIGVVLEEHFSDREIKLLTRFFSSALGRKMVARKVHMDHVIAEMSINFARKISEAIDKVEGDVA
jgi:hypothetical protein